MIIIIIIVIIILIILFLYKNKKEKIKQNINLDPYHESRNLLDDFQEQRNDVFKRKRKINKDGKSISEIYDYEMAIPEFK